jgi:hypothetical protein
MSASRPIPGTAIGWFVLAGISAVCGCRQQPPEPTHNRNLGDQPGELMPVAVSPADPRILQDQSGVTEQALTVQAAHGSARPADREAPTPPDQRTGSRPPSVATEARPEKPKAESPPGKAGSLEGLISKASQKQVNASSAGPAGSQPVTAKPARTVDSLVMQMKAPWAPWKPSVGQGLIAAYTLKGEAEVAAWSMDLPKEIKPEMVSTPVGQFALAAKLKEQAKRQFELIDKWQPMSRMTAIDGIQALEVSCTVKPGPVAGSKGPSRAVCFGIVGKTKGLLVVYRIADTSKNADAIRRDILAAIKLK